MYQIARSISTNMMWKPNGGSLRGETVTIKTVFEADVLDAYGYVIRPVKLEKLTFALHNCIQNKVLISDDDPKKDDICALSQSFADVIVIEHATFGGIAVWLFNEIGTIIFEEELGPRVSIVSVSIENAENYVSFSRRYPI